MTEKSAAPGTPEITDFDQESVDLKWTAPKSDGGAKIEKYIIEKKDRYTSNNYCYSTINLMTKLENIID